MTNRFNESKDRGRSTAPLTPQEIVQVLNIIRSGLYAGDGSAEIAQKLNRTPEMIRRYLYLYGTKEDLQLLERNNRRKFKQFVARAQQINRSFVGRGEQELAYAFQYFGIRTLQQFPIESELGRTIVDIYLPEFRVAVEVVSSNPVTSQKRAVIEKAGVSLEVVDAKSLVDRDDRWSAFLTTLDVLFKYQPYFWLAPMYVGPVPAFIEVFEPVNVWIRARWKPQCKFAFVTTCSFGKPYSATAIHRAIRHALREGEVLDKLDYIHLSSAGVIPAKFETLPPLLHYDYNTEVATEQDLQFLRFAIARRMRQFFELFNYEKIFVYVRPGSNTAKAIAESDLEVIPVFPWPNGPLAKFEPNARQLQELEEERALKRFPDIDDYLLLPSNLKYAVSKIRKELMLDE